MGVGGGVHFRHNTKGWGGGGGGGSCLAEGEVPYMKGQLYDLLVSYPDRIITTSIRMDVVLTAIIAYVIDGLGTSLMIY